jgi:peptide deformylase
MTEILQKEEKVLRKKAKEVPVTEIKSEKIQSILSRMKKALKSQGDGVGLAAPQIGESLRIFIVSGRIFDRKQKSLEAPKHPDEVYINPTLKKASKQKKMMEEGCLSVRPYYGKVKRSTHAQVEAYNEKGELFTRQGTGILAQIFQHEIDHLDGVLFIDKATDIEEIPELVEDNETKGELI